MAARYFNVGVPLYVEVAEDGTVTFDVDLTEVEIDEDDGRRARADRLVRVGCLQ